MSGWEWRTSSSDITGPTPALSACGKLRWSPKASWIACEQVMKTSTKQRNWQRPGERPAQNQHKTAKPAETSRNQHKTSIGLAWNLIVKADDKMVHGSWHSNGGLQPTPQDHLYEGGKIEGNRCISIKSRLTLYSDYVWNIDLKSLSWRLVLRT